MVNRNAGGADGAGGKGSAPKPPLAPPVWTLKSALVLDTDRRTLETFRAEMVRRGSGDIDHAVTADEALDMIGGVSRPYDAILLAAGRMQLESIHVLTMLLKQRSRSVAFGYTVGSPPATTALRSFFGVADWLDLRDGDRWPRRLARALADGASVQKVLERGRVPWDIEPLLAKAIYGAPPGSPFQPPAKP